MNNKTNDVPGAPNKSADDQRIARTDLQYVSLQEHGKTYGGWYRVLPDGGIELIALANIQSARRNEKSPSEQARSMLAEFIRASQLDAARTESAQSRVSTLGGLLFAGARTAAPENDWLDVIRAVASGDATALRALFEITHRLVFTLLMRMTGGRSLAEHLTVETFDRIWRSASQHDPASATVLGWIMTQARSVGVENMGKRSRDPADACAINPAAGVQPENADVLRPHGDLWTRVAERIGASDDVPRHRRCVHETPPRWEMVAPGIECKLLSRDRDGERVSMLVRLAPGMSYPPHRHAGLEELHLLHGELVINGRMLHPGDYNRAVAGTSDHQVWTSTGCTCVLFTSTADVIG